MAKWDERLPQRKISYYDMTQLSSRDLCHKYKMTPRELEYQVRNECKGASTDQQKAFYAEVYDKKLK